MGRSLRTFSNPLSRLIDGSLPPISGTPRPGFQFSHEIFQSESGGGFTGNILEVPVAKREGFFEGIIPDLIAAAPTFASFAAAPFTGGKSLLAAPALAAKFAGPPPVAPKLVGRVPMGFFDDIFGTNDTPGDFGGFGSNSGFDFTGLLNAGVGIANQFIAPRSQGIPTSLAMSPALPAVIGAGGVVVRGAMTALSARLAAVGLTRASAWSLLKSQGPAALLAVGLTAAEVVHISRTGSGRRRMNMCNGRALRRAQRRLSAFHNFYKKTCGLPSVRRRTKRC